jgi:formylglycine-generating enzyme required for sulfatase activity
MRLLMAIGLVMGFWFAALPARAACSLDDSLMLARAGYSKSEIEAKCEGGGATSAGSGPTGSLPMEKVPGPTEKVPGTVFRDCPDCPEMVVIPAGSFQMGSDAAEQKWADSQEDSELASSESPRHRVTIGYSLAVGKYEVTQAEWQSIMGRNPSEYPGPRNPIENVSWDDAQEFIHRLNAKLRGTQPVSTGGDGPYRLLTEAEWEYAARAGTSTKFSWGDGLEGCAYANGPDLTAKSEKSDWATSNCRDGYGIQTAPVGSFRANTFALHDMHGNVWEWVQDCMVENYTGAPTDGSAVSGENSCPHVIRGGSFDSYPSSLRSAARYATYSTAGFRLARTF